MIEQASFVKIPCFTNPEVGPTSSKLIVSEFSCSSETVASVYLLNGPSAVDTIVGVWWVESFGVAWSGPDLQQVTVSPTSCCDFYLYLFHVLLKFELGGYCFLSSHYKSGLEKQWVIHIIFCTSKSVFWIVSAHEENDVQQPNSGINKCLGVGRSVFYVF